MKTLNKKLGKNSGFTLIEMLIVVAIIAILIAIAIPMMSSSLDKARKASDDANERAAKGAALICFMTDNDLATNFNGSGPYTTFYTADGEIAKNPKLEAGKGYGQYKTQKGQYIQVTITDGVASCGWVASNAGE